MLQQKLENMRLSKSYKERKSPVNGSGKRIMKTSEEPIPIFQQKVERKIGFIEDADATGEVAKVYDEWRAHSGRQNMPGILKCFSHRPDFLRQVMDFSNTVHFSQGHLDRRTKEAIASYVSYLNRCPY